MFAALFILVLAFVLVWVWRSRATETGAAAPVEEAAESQPSDVISIDAETRRTTELKVVPAETRPFAAMIQTTGVVEPNATRVAHVRLLAPGRVDAVNVRVGDRVRNGQPLLTYDNIELGSLVGEYLTAAAAVERAVAEAEVARRALERASRLVEAGGLSRAEYERRDAEHKRALAAVATERAAVANVDLKLQRFGMTNTDVAALRAEGGDVRTRSRTVVRAPFTGVITASNVAPGDAVDTQRELFTVADLATVWVLGDVYQRDIAAIRTGQEVHLTTETYPGERFVGRVTHISDLLDPASRTAKVRIEVPNRDTRLKLGMFVRVQLPTTTERETVVIPAAALQDVDGASVVFVETGPTTFQKRAVQTGDPVANAVPVLAGLQAGERIVTDGAFMLKSKLKAGSIGEGEEEEKRP